MNRLFCQVLAVVFFITSCVPASWGQQAQRRAVNPLDRLVSEQVIAQTNQQYATQIKQAQQELDKAFEYQDIAQKLLRLHKIAQEQAGYQREVQNMQRVITDAHQSLVHSNDAIPAVRQPVMPVRPHENALLGLIANGKVTPEQLLNYLDPLDPQTISWEDSMYAAMALSNTLVTTQEAYPGLENYMRQAQLRILHRLAQANLTQENASNQTVGAVGQLRLAMLVLHHSYIRLFGKDPLEQFNASSARSSRQQISRRPARFVERGQQAPVLNLGNTFAAANNQNIYEKIRSHFLREIRYFKNELPKDPYTFSKLVRTLQGRNQTENFSFGQAAGDIIVNDVLFFIPLAKTLGDFIFGDNSKTPTANLTALAPLAVEYDLLDSNFEHVKKIVQALEPEKLAENNREAIFKNDAMYQATQPVIAEIFNTLYVYALTPGHTQKQWLQTMDLFTEFANPKRYSIMTRLSAISTAAKLMDLRYQAKENTPWKQADPNAKDLKDMILPTRHSLPANLRHLQMQQPQGITPYSHWSDPNVQFEQLTGKAPYAYADLMAQRIADIYATLLKGHVAGTQDYGLGAKQTKVLEDELAKLYNIFAREASNKERYPIILPLGADNLETRMEYRDGKSYKEQVLYHYGARVALSSGGTVDMNLDNPLQSHFDKDAGEFFTQFVVDVVTWKFLVGVVRVGGKVVRAGKNLIMPKGSKLVLSTNYAPQGGRVGNMLHIDQTAFKAGVNASSPEAQAALKRAQELANLSIPDAATATRAEVCRFLGIAEDASEATFKKALSKMKGKYHPDHFEKHITPQVKETLSSKAGSLAELEKFAKPGSSASAQASGAAQAAQDPKRLTDTATPEMTRWEKMAQTAAARAAQMPQGPIDANSWVNITKGFAQFFAVDYALSYANLPLEKYMQDTEIDKAQRQYKPQSYGNTQKEKESLPNASPMAIFDNVSQAADPQRLGTVVRLPINLGKLMMGSDILGADMRAKMSAAARQQEFTNALTAGNVKKYKEQVAQEIDRAEKGPATFDKQYGALLSSVPASTTQIKQIFATYKQALQQALALADSDIQASRERMQEGAKQFNHTSNELLLKCSQAYWTQQEEPLIKQRLSFLRQYYPAVLTPQDEAQVTQLMKNYVSRKKQIQTQYFTLSKEPQTNQAALQDLNKQAQQEETHLANAWGKLTLRLGLDMALQTIPKKQIQFMWNNAALLAAVPSAAKEIKQLYATYTQDLKRARAQVETDVEQASNIEQEATVKFISTQAGIMVRCTQAYWPAAVAELTKGKTAQLQQTFFNQLSIAELGQVQAAVKEYCRQSQEAGVAYWQAVANLKTTAQEKQNIVARQTDVEEHFNNQLENIMDRVQARIDADPWLKFVQALYVESAQELEAAFPYYTYAYQPEYKQVQAIQLTYLQSIQAALEAMDPQHPDQAAFNKAKLAAKQTRDVAWNKLKGQMRWQKLEREWKQEHPAFQPSVEPTWQPPLVIPYRPYDQWETDD